VVGLYGGYRYGWKWTGIVKDADFHKRTLWDWLDLLIVPAVLALGGYLFTRSENQRSRDIAGQQRTVDQEIADQRAQDEALQAYLDQMSQLLLDKDRPLLKSKMDSEANTFSVRLPTVLRLKQSLKSKTDGEANTSEASTLAKARTLTVLTRLNGRRKRSVVDFLYEARLIGKNSKGLGDYPLKEADLREAHLSEAHLIKADLRHARLSEANLERADLRGANLHGAKLSKAVLSGARLGSPPREEDGEPNPTPADLSGADLSGADLSGADLSGARGVINEELEQQAASLEGATMPNGQKYEDWLKDKESRGEYLTAARRPT